MLSKERKPEKESEREGVWRWQMDAISFRLHDSDQQIMNEQMKDA